MVAVDLKKKESELDALTPEAPQRSGIHKVKLPDGETGWQEWTDRALFDSSGNLIEFQSVGRDVTDRILTENALAESEARFRGLVENTSDWVWEMDRDGRNTYSNRRVEDLLGYTPEELRGMDWRDLIHADNIEEIDERIDRLMRGRRGWQQWVVRVRHRDGNYRYVESTADPVFDDNDDLIGYRGIDRDVTFRTLMSQISTSLIGLDTVDLDARIRRAFAAIGSCYGIERISLWWMDGEYIRRRHEWSADGRQLPTMEFIPDETVPWSTSRLREGAIVRVNSSTELPAASPDRALLERMGARSVLLFPLSDQGSLVGVASFSMLSSEREWSQDIESDLRHLSEKVVAAYSQSEAARVIQRREGDMAQSEGLAHVGSFVSYPRRKNAEFPTEWRLEFSPEQSALLEAKPGEASFDLFLSRVHEDDRRMILDAVESLLNGSEVALQYRVINPSGDLKYFSNRTRMDRDEDGRNLRMIGANRDITDQVLREESLKGALAEIEKLKDRLEERYFRLREEVRNVEEFEQIVGDSDVLRHCLDLAAKAAPTDATVLILGETGTGKELVAKAIHDLSSRRDGPMVSLNCTALPIDLVESELFGHERGAFTGAHKRRTGRFEAAAGGTLFLDEIGDLPRQLQGKLLRVVQDGGFERVGGAETIHSDVRLVAATNRDLEKAVERGEFRADLYYRINTIPIRLPPLRERREDIPLLAQHFVMKHGPRLGKSIESISAGLLTYLQEQRWPGNVRELEHFIERALISQRGPVLSLGDVDSFSAGGGAGEVSAPDLRSVEREHILQVLRETHWVIGGADGAATRLGLPPSTLRSKMKKLGIERHH